MTIVFGGGCVTSMLLERTLGRSASLGGAADLGGPGALRDQSNTITLCDVLLTSLGEIVHPAVCVADKPTLEDRPPMSGAQAANLARTFKVLGNDTRLRMLHALQRVGEMSVSDLAVEAGVSAQGASNQLQRLVDRRIVAARRDGNHVFYRVVDPCVPALLELGLCLTEEAQSPGWADDAEEVPA